MPSPSYFHINHSSSFSFDFLISICFILIQFSKFLLSFLQLHPPLIFFYLLYLVFILLILFFFYFYFVDLFIVGVSKSTLLIWIFNFSTFLFCWSFICFQFNYLILICIYNIFRFGPFAFDFFFLDSFVKVFIAFYFILQIKIMIFF